MNNNETTIRVSEFFARIHGANKPVDVITTLHNLDFTATYPKVHAADIKYIEATDKINVGGWQDNFDLVIPSPEKISRKDLENGTIIYTARTGDLITSFVVE